MMEQEVPQPSSDSVRDPCYAQITSDEAVNKLQKDASDNIRSGSDTDKIMAEDSKETVKAEEELNEKDITEPDEYNYTKRDDFTSEIFKLAISNLPRKFGFKEFKKKMAKLDINPVKMKVWKDICFLTFRNDTAKLEALEKLNGLNWKGKELVAAVAKPAADPLMRKRKLENSSCGDDSKKARTEEEELSPTERLRNSVTPLWRLEYSEQLKRKQAEMRSFLKKYHHQLERNCSDLTKWLRESRQKFGGIPCELQEILPSPVTEGYRNKCEFTIGPGLDKSTTVGFRYGTYAEGNVCVGSAEDMSIISEVMNHLLKAFQKYLAVSQYQAFNPEDLTGHWRQLAVRTSRLQHLMIKIDFHPQNLTQEEIEKEQEKLKTYFTEGPGKSCNVTSCYFRAHADKTTVSDVEYSLLFGEENITESLLGMQFQVSPNAFFQVNTLGAEVLYTTVGEYCKPAEKTTILDVCCGTGTIGLTLAKKVEKVIGVEMCAPAIEDAKVNADLNGIANVTYHCAKAEDVMKDITRSVLGSDEVVAIVDPPRGGLHTSVVVAIRNCRSITRLVYVSCHVNGALNNITDLVRPTSKRLTGPRFLPVKAVPVDLFPHTNHCELVLLFERVQTDT